MQHIQINKKLWLILLLTVLVIYIGLTALNLPLFLPDEGRYAEIAREMLHQSDWVTPMLNGLAFFDKPILCYWQMMAAMGVFGVHAWVVRLMPLFYGLSGLALTYYWGRHFFGKQVAVYATLILASNTLYLSLSHYVNMDLAVAFWLNATMACFSCFLFPTKAKPSQSWLWLGYVCMGLGFLSKGLIACVLPGLTVAAYFIYQRRWTGCFKLKPWWGIIILALITAPWLIMAAKAHAHFLYQFFIVQHFQRYLGTQFNGQYGIWFYGVILLLSFLPWSFLLPSIINPFAKRFSRALHQRQLLSWLRLWVVVMLVFFSIPVSKLMGYIAPALIPLSLLMANYFAQKIEQKMPVWRAAPWLWLIWSCFFIALLWWQPWRDEAVIAPYVHYLFIGLWLGSALMLFLPKIRYSVHRIFLLMFVTGLAHTLLLVTVLCQWPSESTYALSQKIRGHLGPKTMLLVDASYPYDLLFYTQKIPYVVGPWSAPITRDNWQRELANGLVSGRGQHFLIQRKHAHALWKNAKHEVILVTQHPWHELSSKQMIAQQRRKTGMLYAYWRR